MMSLLPHHFVDDSVGDDAAELAATPSRAFSPTDLTPGGSRRIETPVGRGYFESPRASTPRRVMRTKPKPFRLEPLEPHDSPMKLANENAKPRKANERTQRSSMPARVLTEIRGNSNTHRPGTQGNTRRHPTTMDHMPNEVGPLKDRISDEQETCNRKEAVLSSASTCVPTPDSEPHRKETARAASKSSGSAEVPKETQPGALSSSKERMRLPSKGTVAKDQPARGVGNGETRKETRSVKGALTTDLSVQETRSASKVTVTKDHSVQEACKETRSSLATDFSVQDDALALGLHKVFGFPSQESEEESEEEDSEVEVDDQIIKVYRPRPVEQIKVRAQDFLQHKGDVKTLRACKLDQDKQDGGTDEASGTSLLQRGMRRATIGGESFQQVQPEGEKANTGDGQDARAKLQRGFQKARTMSKVAAAFKTVGPVPADSKSIPSGEGSARTDSKSTRTDSKSTRAGSKSTRADSKSAQAVLPGSEGAASHTPRGGTKNRPDQLRATVETFRAEAQTDPQANDESSAPAAKSQRTRALWKQAAISAVAARDTAATL